MPFTNAEKQRRFRARLLADPHKTAEYKMTRRLWRKKKEDGRHVPVVQHVTNYETLQKRVQHVRCEREPFAMVKRHEEMCGGMRCMLPLDYRKIIVSLSHVSVSPLYCDSFLW